METGIIKNQFPLPVLMAAFGLVLAGRVTAQTFTVLHDFTATSGHLSTNSDGARPSAGLILSGNALYGTAWNGGSSGSGTVFALNTNGTGFTTLHSFNYSDGDQPFAGLILSGNLLYGTTFFCGSSDHGTVFAVKTDGTDFSNLYCFGDGDGAMPYARLILSGSILYGTTAFGGTGSNGTVFAINTNGTGFTNLHSFTAGGYNPSGYYTNRDGASPSAGLILSGDTLYGTTGQGGSSGNGTVFAINTDGSGFTNLHDFSAISAPLYDNSDGAIPFSDLFLSGNILYGTAQFGGSSGYGTVFAVNTDGSGFTNLHSFTAGGYSSPGVTTNNDGAFPHAGLILSGNTLYGTAYSGGSSGNGTLFKVNTDGTGFMALYSFTATSGPLSTNSDGARPSAVLILSGNALYGTTSGGGSCGNGTVFILFIQPQLIITPAGANVILTWPTNYDGFTLQSASNLVSPVWTTNLPPSAVVNGQNTVTNPISGTQQFFRLAK